MIPVSDEWRKYFYEYRSHLLVRGILTTASGDVYYLDYEDSDDDFIEMSLTDATSSESCFDVGNFVLNTCTFKLNNSDRKWKNILLENAKLEPYVGFQHPRLNYALASGNYNTDSDTGAWTASATAFSNYYTITAYDGYMRLQCKSATSTAYYVCLSLADDFDSNVENYTVTFKVRASTSKAINVYVKREDESGNSSYVQVGTISASEVTANTWAEHSVTFSPDEDYTYTGIGFSMGTFNASGNYLDVEYLIVEQGEEFTEYNRAREDFTENGAEWVKKGTFYISDTGKRGSRISLTAYDNTNAFETSFSGVSITYPITLANFVQTICDYVGITLATTTFPNSTYSISTAPNTSSTDYTCRQMISYAAMLAGCYARCNVDGELEFKWYDSTTNIHSIPAYSSFDNNESDTEITGVKVVAMASENVDSSTDEDSSESTSDEYTYGSDDDYLITIQENPLIPYGSAEEIATLIGEQIVGTTFRSSEMSALYDPSMEAGDTIQTENEDEDTVTFYAANISVSLGSYATIKCSSDEDNSSSGSTSVLSYIMGQTADLVNAKFENFITKNLSAEVANIGFLKADELEAELATIGYLSAEEIDATYVKADELEATYIKADELEATVATFGYLTADTIIADDVTVTSLAADVASINSLLAGTVSAETAQIIHITADNTVIDEAVIYDAMIVDLSASKITAGTIYTSFVTIQTDEDDKSLYIANDLIAMYDENDVMRLQAGSTDSLTGGNNGYNFVIWDADGNTLFNATGITAEGIPSETIVNAHVAENAAISGSKLDITSVISYIEDDGSLTVDSAHVQIDNTTLDVWYTNTNKKVEETAASSITDTETEYYLSTSATELTGGSWSTTQPTWTEGTYLWVRTTYTYGSGETATSEPVCITGNTGADGGDGVSVVSIVNYYLATASSSGVTTSTSGWSTNVSSQTISSSKPYLWNYEVTTFSDGDTETVAPHIVGTYGENGVGISSIDEYYALSTSNSIVTGTWGTSVQTVTSTNKYLWNYEVVNYTDGTTQSTAQRIIGVYGDTGADGTGVNILGTAYTKETSYTTGEDYTLYSDSGLTTKITGAESGDAYLVNGYLFVYSGTAFTCAGVIQGEDGVGIELITNYYLATSASSGVLTTTSGWSTTVQTVATDKKYLWNYEQIDYTDGTTAYTSPCIIGVYGDTGDTGVGIDSITEYYALSTSNTSVTGTWSTSVPTMTETNRFLWNYEVVKYTDGTSDTGSQRIIGVYGEKGTDGKTSYFHIKYSDVENPTSASDMTETPSTYIGTYVDYTAADSTDPSDYTWSKFSGEDGAQGIAGKDGTDGTTYYLHIAYANSEDGKTDFSVSDSTDKEYIGTCTDTNEDDPTDYTKYAWSKIKGEQGEQGIQGLQGIQGEQGEQGIAGKDGDDGVGIESVTAYYAVGDSSTEKPSSPSTSTWKTSMSDLTVGDTQYLWVAYYIVYTDGTKAWTEPACLTDAATREQTKTLQTELKVVQGYIGLIVGEDDITNLEDGCTAFHSEYSTIVSQVGTITSEVSDITTFIGDDLSTQTTLSSLIEQKVEDGTASLALSVSETYAYLPENLISDGTFEGYTTFGSSYSWYRSSSSYIEVSEYNDKPCIAFTYAGAAYYLRQAITAEKGVPYKISMKIACGTAYAPVVNVMLQRYTASTYVTYGSAYMCSDGDLTDGWVTYSTTITATSAPQYIAIYVYSATGATTATATEVYITDITMYNQETISEAVSASLVLSIEEDEDGNSYGALSANADYIYLKTGDLIIESDQFTLDAEGNATFGGAITAGSLILSDGDIFNDDDIAINDVVSTDTGLIHVSIDAAYDGATPTGGWNAVATVWGYSADDTGLYFSTGAISEDGQSYTYTIKICNNDSDTITVSNGLGGSQDVASGEEKLVTLTGTGDGKTELYIKIQSSNVVDQADSTTVYTYRYYSTYDFNYYDPSIKTSSYTLFYADLDEKILVINSPGFSLNSDGKVALSGDVTAESLNVSKSINFYYGDSSYSTPLIYFGDSEDQSMGSTAVSLFIGSQNSSDVQLGDATYVPQIVMVNDLSCTENVSIMGAATLKSTLTVSSNISTTGGNIYLSNNKRLYSADSSGSNRTLAYLSSDDYYYYGTGETANRVYIGTESYTEYLMLRAETVRAYGEFYCYAYGTTTFRRPIQSATSDGTRVCYISSGSSRISVNGQFGTTGSTYSTYTISATSSDIRLKQDVMDCAIEATPVIRQMQLRQFDWKLDSIHQDIGFIADELELLDSKLAIGGGENEEGQPVYKSIDTLYLLGYVVKALQELDSRLTLAGI